MLNKIGKPIFILAISAMLFACNSDKPAVAKQEAMAKAKADSIAQVATKVNEPKAQGKFTYVEGTDMKLNPKGYTYGYDEADKSGKSKDVSYYITEVDRPPMFSDKCLTKKQPMDCSNEAIQSYFSTNIEYPAQADRSQSDGLEYVTFTVEPDGSIGPNFSVVTKEKSCKSCAEAAVKAIGAMPNWVPALKDGKAVRTILVLPVRFDFDR